MGSETITLILPIIVPYVTAAIKTIWKSVFSSMPRWMGPFKAVLAGVIVSGLSKAVGVPLPSDLANLTDDTTMAILSSGAIIGAAGSWIRDVADGIKKDYSAKTALGKAIRSIAGK